METTLSPRNSPTAHHAKTRIVWSPQLGAIFADFFIPLLRQPPPTPSVTNRRDGAGTHRNHRRHQQWPRTLPTSIPALPCRISVLLSVGNFLVQSSRGFRVRHSGRHCSVGRIDWLGERAKSRQHLGIFGSRRERSFNDGWARAEGIFNRQREPLHWLEPTRSGTSEEQRFLDTDSLGNGITEQGLTCPNTENHSPQHPQDQDQPHQGPVFPPHCVRPRHRPRGRRSRSLRAPHHRIVEEHPGQACP